jgi:hypothetical protein
MKWPKIIGIAGAAGSGKDTCAQQLHDYYRYEIRAFATPIKVLLNQRFGWTMEQWEDRAWKERPDPAHGTAFVQHSVDTVTGPFSVGYHDPMSPRSWAQWLGTEAFRELAGMDFWAKRLINQWAADSFPEIVIPDVRFDNEVYMIRRQGGVVLYLQRDAAQSIEAHVSERALNINGVDAVIDNNGPIESLRLRVLSALLDLEAAK